MPGSAPAPRLRFGVVGISHGHICGMDVSNRTETATTQAHCFLAAELALVAQDKARVVS
jgi:hypothetical protein